MIVHKGVLVQSYVDLLVNLGFIYEFTLHLYLRHFLGEFL